MLVEPQRTSLAPEEAKTKEAKENRKKAQAKQRALRNKETELQWWKPQPQPALASSLDLASFVTLLANHRT